MLKIKQKRHSITSGLCAAILLVSASPGVFAISEIPEETGVSGFINLAVMGMSVESNTLAETPFNDLGAANIDNLTDEPDSESGGVPIVNFELSYTWAESSSSSVIFWKISCVSTSPPTSACARVPAARAYSPRRSSAHPLRPMCGAIRI
jgi:hypothetical protein